MFNLYVSIEGILIIIGLIAIFIIFTVLNSKIKKPDGCENDESCETCLIKCIHNTNSLIEENDDK